MDSQKAITSKHFKNSISKTHSKLPFSQRHFLQLPLHFQVGVEHLNKNKQEKVKLGIYAHAISQTSVNDEKKLCFLIPDEKPKLQLSSALIKKQSQLVKKTQDEYNFILPIFHYHKS